MCGCFLGWPSVAYHFWVTVTLTSDLVFRIIVSGAFFSILFELGIPNLVCGCNFGWQSVIYQFCDIDIISRIILSGAYLIYYLREESQICCMDTSLDADVSHILVSRIIVSGAYLLYNWNPKFGVLIPLGMVEWCIPFWVTLTLTLTSGLISRFFVSGAYLLYYS